MKTTTEIVHELIDKGVLVTPAMLKTIQAQNSQATNTPQTTTPPPVHLVKNYTKKTTKREVADFVQHYTIRFKTIERMIRQRPEARGTTTIQRAMQSQAETSTIIGMICEKQETKNKNIILEVEDLTGRAKVIISQNNNELLQQAKDLFLDEIIGITARKGDGVFFATDIIHPDIPFHELKKSPEERYIAVIGDLHFGSKKFLAEEFNKFLEWINGNVGSESQKRIAQLVDYLIFIGDVVEGVGVYPGQEEDLTHTSIKEQFKGFATLLKKIPSSKRIIIGPGNHEPVRLAEPQPPIPQDLAPELYNMPNVTLTSNPATFILNKTNTFPGLTILYYHGYSIPYYADNIPSIRAGGGLKKVDLIMKELLKRRHLAPTHNSNQYLPDPEEDHLIIDTIPDIFITGHVHRVAVSSYKNVTIINGSCWTDMTENQEKRGLENQPGKVPLINTQTREVRILNFHKETNQRS
ncbi:hypothetical protein D6783_04500 [Candidatus Woesearchaeota archaeon]|nr:MAG: hypothetical protein D6783_04500 [Candidatus Woesearchaeota archaeon]